MTVFHLQHGMGVCVYAVRHRSKRSNNKASGLDNSRSRSIPSHWQQQQKGVPDSVFY